MIRQAAFMIALLALPYSGYAAEHDCIQERPAAVDVGPDEPALGRVRRPDLSPAEASALQYRDGQSEVSADDIRARKVD